MDAPLAADAEIRLDMADVRALAVGAVFVIARAMLKQRTVRLVLETRRFAEGVERAAHGVGAVEHRALALDQLEPVNRIRVHSVPVLHRTATPGGVVDAHAIDHQEVLPTGKTADVRRSMAVGRFLDKHAGRELQRLRQSAPRVFPDEIRINGGRCVSCGTCRLFAPRSGDKQRIEKILGKTRRPGGQQQKGGR